MEAIASYLVATAWRPLPRLLGPVLRGRADLVAEVVEGLVELLVLERRLGLFRFHVAARDDLDVALMFRQLLGLVRRQLHVHALVGHDAPLLVVLSGGARLVE